MGVRVLVRLPTPTCYYSSQSSFFLLVLSFSLRQRRVSLSLLCLSCCCFFVLVPLNSGPVLYFTSVHLTPARTFGTDCFSITGYRNFKDISRIIISPLKTNKKTIKAMTRREKRNAITFTFTVSRASIIHKVVFIYSPALVN